MQFDFTVSISDILVVIGFIFTVYALLMNYRQLKRNEAVEKASFLSNIIDRMLGDRELRKFFYKLDYGKFEFDETKLQDFKGTNSEIELDSLLYQYNYVGKLVRDGVLSLNDIEFMIFEIVQVFKNKEVAKYLIWLDGEFKLHGTIDKNSRKRPYDDARWLLDNVIEADARP